MLLSRAARSNPNGKKTAPSAPIEAVAEESPAEKEEAATAEVDAETETLNETTADNTQTASPPETLLSSLPESSDLNLSSSPPQSYTETPTTPSQPTAPSAPATPSNPTPPTAPTPPNLVHEGELNEVIDYGVYCGTCGGLWGMVNNTCPNCFPANG